MSSNNRKPVYFQDQMDETRVVEIVRNFGNKVEVKVFSCNDHGDFLYNGRSVLPARLFDPNDSRNQRHGYTPYG
jgi:hypothetical protein